MWLVTKEWPGIPETRQPATQQRFTTKEEAEQKAAELRLDLPARIFTVISEQGGKNGR